MEENKIDTLRQPGEVADPLTEVLRNGTRALLAQAVEAEIAEALAAHAHLTTDDGRPQLRRREPAGRRSLLEIAQTPLKISAATAPAAKIGAQNRIGIKNNVSLPPSIISRPVSLSI